MGRPGFDRRVRRLERFESVEPTGACSACGGRPRVVFGAEDGSDDYSRGIASPPRCAGCGRAPILVVYQDMLDSPA